MPTTITWVEVDLSFPTLGPLERLRALTAATQEGPADVRWRGLVIPFRVDSAESFAEVTVSLAGGVRFTAETLSRFASMAEGFAAAYTPSEKETILRAQQERGNPRELWKATAGLLWLVSPRRLVERAKADMASVFESSTILETSEDADYRA